MNLEKAQTTWEQQMPPQLADEKMNQMVQNETRKVRNQTFGAFITTVFCIVVAIWGVFLQHSPPGQSQIVSVLRGSTILISIVPLVLLTLKRRKLYRQRINAGLDQSAWTKQIVADLGREIKTESWILMSIFAVIPISLIGLTKWIEYQDGTDTAGEGFMIMGIAVTLLIAAAISSQHHRELFLKPRYERYKKLLDEIESSK